MWRMLTLMSLEHGVNFFDTAEIYGLGIAETSLGKTFKELKELKEENKGLKKRRDFRERSERNEKSIKSWIQYISIKNR